MKIKPLFDRVIVECSDEKTTKSGIFLGVESQNSTKEAKVLFVGSGTEKQDGTFSKMFVEVGDTILFNKFTATEATIDGKLLYILRQTDILAILN